MPIKNQFPLMPASFFLDIFTTIASFYAAFHLRSLLLKAIPFGAVTELKGYYPLLFIIVAIWLWLLTMFGAYHAQQPMFVSVRREFLIVSKTVAIGILILFTGLFFLKLEVAFLPRSFIFLFLIVNFIFLLAEKLMVFYLVRFERKQGHNTNAVVVIGCDTGIREVLEQMERHPEYGLRPVKVFSNGVEGADDAIEDFLRKNHVDEVIIAAEDKATDITKIFKICSEEGVKTRIIPRLLNKSSGRINIERLGEILTFTISETPHKEWQVFFKRLIDISASLILLTAFLPLFLIIALAIKLSSPGPLFYEWKVMGFNKKPFKSWKFRTMVNDADKVKEKLLAQNEMSGPVFKIENDPRITKVGRVLRKFSIDELPQLLSVLKGDMSLVGPRPPLQKEVEKFERWHSKKLRIKPGLTCLWQVGGRNKIKDFNEWVRLDVDYIKNWSLWLDLKILVLTIPAVFRGTGR